MYYLIRRNEIENLLHLWPLPKELIILEFGCGAAYQARLLARKVARVYCTDLPAPDSIESFSLRHAACSARVEGFNNMYFVASSAEALPFQGKSFDLIYNSYVMEHFGVDERKKVLSETSKCTMT